MANKTLRIPLASSTVSDVMVFAILFLMGFSFTLPFPPTVEHLDTYPFWANSPEVAGILAYELLYAAWFALFGCRRLVACRMDIQHSPIFKAALLMALLGILGVVTSLTVSPQWEVDSLRSARIVVVAFMVPALYLWCKQFGSLVAVVTTGGAAVGTLIYIFISATQPFIVNELPRFHGQNTAGVVMAVALQVAVWLFLFNSSKKLRFYSFVAISILAAGASLSYSRTAWIIVVISTLGSLAFGKRLGLSVVLATAVGIVIAASILQVLANPAHGENREVHNETVSADSAARPNSGIRIALGDSTAMKFNQAELSNSARMSYYIATFDIVREHPFGVGFSGFPTAYSQSMVARGAGIQLADNPHSSLLWYATALGVGGVISFVGITVLFSFASAQGLYGRFGIRGFWIACFWTMSYVLIAGVVTYALIYPIVLLPFIYGSSRNRNLMK